MSFRPCVLLFVVAASIAQGQSEKAPLKKELAELQGVWRLYGFEIDGKEAYLMDEKQPRLVFKGDKVLWGGEELAKVTLDPAAKPRLIDLAFTQNKRIHEGIYQLDKNRLKICVGVITEGVKDRPLNFDTKGIDKYRTMLLERDKPGNELVGVPGFVGVQLRIDVKTEEIQIVEPLKGSPAEKAGVKKDDIILKVGSDAAGTLQETVNLVRQFRPGSDLVLRIRRADKEMDIKIKVGVAPFGYLD